MPYVDREQFRAVFNAPELDQPVAFTKGLQNTIVPFDKFWIEQKDPDLTVGILETTPYDPTERDPLDDPDSYADAGTFVRTRYESTFGLAAKVVEQLRYKQKPEILLQTARLIRNFGPVSLVIGIAPRPFPLGVRDFMPREESNFLTWVSVIANSPQQEDKPPLAQVTYTKADIMVPTEGEFAEAEYEKALTEGVEQRQDRWGNKYHPATYFHARYLKGTMVGRRWFADEQSPELKYSDTEATINPRSPQILSDRNHRAAVYYYKDDSFMARISFARINTQSGESWLLSVPDWIDNGELKGSLSTQCMIDTIGRFPVSFGVRRPGHEDQWFVSGYSTKREKEIMDALLLNDTGSE